MQHLLLNIALVKWVGRVQAIVIAPAVVTCITTSAIYATLALTLAPAVTSALQTTRRPSAAKDVGADATPSSP